MKRAVKYEEVTRKTEKREVMEYMKEIERREGGSEKMNGTRREEKKIDIANMEKKS